MTTSIWIMIISRVLICLCAGEIAIRYAGWTMLLWRSKEKLVAAPIIAGVALWAAARFGVEFSWIIAMGGIKVGQVATLVDGDKFSEVFRIGIIAALSFLTYPVSKVQYGYSWEKALVEMIVRVFLITVSIVAGYMIAMVRLHYIGA